MAIWRTHKCNGCEYSFVGSGKPDALMMGPTIPVVCSKCNEIYDRIIESPIDKKLNYSVKSVVVKSILNGITRRRNAHIVKMALLKRVKVVRWLWLIDFKATKSIIYSIDGFSF